MLLKFDAAPPFDTRVPVEVVLQMVKNNVENTLKKDENGDARPMDPEKDSYAVHFKKDEIDKLFSDNGYNPNVPDSRIWGLRIYFGLHTKSAIEERWMPNRKEWVFGQQTGILVSTTDNIDNLKKGSTIATALEEGQICPPPHDCGSISEDLKKALSTQPVE